MQRSRSLVSGGVSPGASSPSPGHLRHDTRHDTRHDARVRKVVMAALLLLPVASTGCVDTADAAKFTGIADGLRTSLPQVTDDIGANCERRNVLVSETPSAESRATPEDCAPYEQISRTLARDERVLADYLDALGALAANKPPAFQGALTESEAAVGNLAGLSTSTATATESAEKIVSIVGAAFTQGYRNKKVNELILKTDPAVQTLCAALITVVQQNYDRLLTNEQNQLIAYYDLPIAARRNDERLTLLLVYRQRDNDMAALRKRRAAIPEFKQAVAGVAKLHAQLAQSAKQHSSVRDVAAQLGPTIGSLKDAIDQLKAGLN